MCEFGNYFDVRLKVDWSQLGN